MIIKLDPNKASGDPKKLIHHLLYKTHENEEITIVQGSETAIKRAWSDARFEGVKDAVIHIKLNPAADEWMYNESWDRGLELLASEIGFNPLSATVVQHTKKGRPHRHIIVPMVDMGTGRKLNLWRYKFKCQKVSKWLETELGHAPTPARTHTKRYLLKRTDGPDYWADHVRALPDARESYSNRDLQKAKRHGYELPELQARFSELIERSDSVSAFKAALNERGFELIEQGKRGRLYFRAIDEPDLELSATKLLGVRKKQLDDYLNTGKKDGLFSTRTTIQNRNRNVRGGLFVHSGGMGRDNRVEQKASDRENSGKRPKIATVTVDERIKTPIEHKPSTASSTGPGRPVSRSGIVAVPDEEYGGGRSTPAVVNKRIAREGEQQRRSEPGSRHSGRPDIIGSGVRSGDDGRVGNEGKAGPARPDIERNPAGIDPAIRAQQQRINNLHTALQDALSRLSSISPRQNPLVAFYGLQNAQKTGMRVQYQNVCRNHQHPVTPDVIERVVSYWDERVSRGSVVSAHGEQRSSRYPYGCYAVQMKGGTVIRDTGDALGVYGPVTSEAAREMVAYARARGWSYVALNGSDRFRDEVAIQCAINGVACNHELSPSASARLNRIQRAITAKSIERLERDLM